MSFRCLCCAVLAFVLVCGLTLGCSANANDDAALRRGGVSAWQGAGSPAAEVDPNGAAQPSPTDAATHPDVGPGPDVDSGAVVADGGSVANGDGTLDDATADAATDAVIDSGTSPACKLMLDRLASDPGCYPTIIEKLIVDYGHSPNDPLMCLQISDVCVKQIVLANSCKELVAIGCS